MKVEASGRGFVVAVRVSYQLKSLIMSEPVSFSKNGAGGFFGFSSGFIPGSVHER